MLFRATVLSLGLILAPVAGVLPAAAQTAAQPADPAHKAAGDRLANINAPDSDVPLMVEGVLGTMFKQIVKQEPEIAELDMEFPGLFLALKDAWRPVFLKAAYQSRPLYRADLSQMYQENLTTEEINKAADFFSQPDVQQYLTAVKRKIDYNATLTEAMADKDVSASAVRSDLGRAGTAAAADLSPELEKKFQTFFGSPLGRKLLALNPKKGVIDAKWVNYSPPGAEEEIGRVTLEAMLTHIAKTDPKLAKQMLKSLEASGDLPKQTR